MSNEIEYTPFGEEWEKELMKSPKKFIIGLYRKSCLKNKKAEGQSQLSETGQQKLLEDRLFTLGEMNKPPCFCCGYNGEGYYQPEKHPCAERHHKLFNNQKG